MLLQETISKSAGDDGSAAGDNDNEEKKRVGLRAPGLLWIELVESAPPEDGLVMETDMKDHKTYNSI